ncbi:DUF1841 family protein [Legionella sp. CNM-4043-24]|uniref:DUF1841 family protein n=1 Tax=Legionella sp. CNM-4043-24 TaxID=3421646 RepID=UPI00403B0F2B
MFFGDQVNDTRSMFYSSWQKYRQGQVLQALEQQLVNVILDHPEYHALLEQSPEHMDQAWFPELGQTNPFLHMGLHLALREQIVTDRPTGISQVFQTLLSRQSDVHATEHAMIDCLAECLWLAQRNQQQPDEQAYLQALTGLTQV